MIAFAGNSLLCRLALKETTIDPASFTFIRIFSGAVVLWLIAAMRRRVMIDRTAPGTRIGFPSPQSSRNSRGGLFSPSEKVRMSDAGDWFSALALFAYAAAFSFAYVSLSAGTGALLLFGAVQATMILWGLRRGERLRVRQLAGLALALAGLVALLFPGLSAPSLSGSILMLGAGIAWGIYSLRGKAAGDAIAATTGNFLRAVPFAALLSIAFLQWTHVDRAGIGYAVFSGAIASGVGYVIWYTALSDSMPVRLGSASAATVQLSVPVLAATGGILLLGELITLRYLVASIAVLGGIALVVVEKNHSGRAKDTISSAAR